VEHRLTCWLRYGDGCRNKITRQVLCPNCLQLMTGKRQLWKCPGAKLMHGVVHEPNERLAYPQTLYLLDLVFPLFRQ
jgi:hypothetical protein